MNASVPPQHDPPALSALTSPSRETPSAPESRTNASKDQAADRAQRPPAETGDSATRLHKLSLRAGFGVGAGTSGAAGSWFLQGDVWFGRFFGIGAEYERAGSTEVAFGPKNSDKFWAPRGRLSLRFPLGETMLLVGSAGLGWAQIKTNRTYPSQDACGGYECDYSFENYKITSHHSSGPSPAFDLGLKWHWSNGEVGLIARVAVAEPANVVTVGPTFGFGF